MEILANKPLGTVTNYLGDVYTINHSMDRLNFRQVYIPRVGGEVLTWPISKDFDLFFIAGGSRFYILSDGTLVHGYNDFSQEELKKIYDILKPFDRKLY